MRSALATDNAFGGPSDSFPSIDGKAVAGSSDHSTVDMDIEKEESFNLDQAIKDGDADSIIAMIEREAGTVSDNWISFIRKSLSDGTLDQEKIYAAKQAARFGKAAARFGKAAAA